MASPSGSSATIASSSVSEKLGATSIEGIKTLGPKKKGAPSGGVIR